MHDTTGVPLSHYARSNHGYDANPERITLEQTDLRHDDCICATIFEKLKRDIYFSSICFFLFHLMRIQGKQTRIRKA